MLLGYRWLPRTAANPTLVHNLGKHLDVASVNYYIGGEPRKGYLESIHKLTGKPLLLSEWSFGCDDRGHSGGCRETANQTERGMYYRAYVEQSAAMPFVVGSQWFEYVDQAVTGRIWGGEWAERFQTGLVDIADRPYKELVKAAAKTNHRIYDVMLGKIKPYSLPESVVGEKPKGGKLHARIMKRTKKIVVDGDISDWPMVARWPKQRTSAQKAI